MANYAFMSIRKLKTDTQLTQTYKHNYRIESPENVDTTMSYLNDEAVSLEGKTLVEAFKEKKASLDYYKDHTFRKDGVKALELTLEYSPEAAHGMDQEEWKKANIEWLERTFNNKYGNNVVSVVFHYDEGSYIGAGAIHGHAIVIPVNDEGHISAKSYMGSKDKLAELQTSYARAMEKFGLERGLKYSSAQHKTIRSMYAKLEKNVNELPIPTRGSAETAESYITRLQDHIYEERASHQYENYQYEKKIRELEYNRTETAKDAYIASVNKENARLRDQIDAKEDLVREMGGIDIVQAKIQNWDDLNYGIQYYPNEETAVRCSEDAQKLIAYGKRQREKKQRGQEKIEEQSL